MRRNTRYKADLSVVLSVKAPSDRLSLRLCCLQPHSLRILYTDYGTSKPNKFQLTEHVHEVREQVAKLSA
jgi:hypothetical protein